MLTVAEVSKTYAGKKLFIEVTTSFAPGNRYGLTGPNGAGKSTFMKILAGLLEPDTGTVSRPRKTAYLKQDHAVYNDQSVLDTVLQGNAPLWAAMSEQKTIYESGDDSDAAGMRLAELEGVIAEENGYMAESEAEELLQGLGAGADGIAGDRMRLHRHAQALLDGDAAVLVFDDQAVGLLGQRDHDIPQASPAKILLDEYFRGDDRAIWTKHPQRVRLAPQVRKTRQRDDRQ